MEFFSKDGFYSTLKGKAVGDEEHEKTLYTIENERFV